MNHGNSISGGANPRRTFRTVDDERPDQENRCQNRSDQCQQCRILECHGRSMNAGSLRCNTGLIRSLSTLLHGIALSRRFEPEKRLLSFKECCTNCCTIALRNPLKRTKIIRSTYISQQHAQGSVVSQSAGRRFKSARRLQFSNGPARRHGLHNVPVTWVTLLGRMDFRAVRAPESPNRSTPNHSP